MVGASLLAAALGYAQAGIPVMPLYTPRPDGTCDCRDGPDCGSPGKHPRLRHGLRDARTDPDAVRRWWRMWPYANIGLGTGTVLDICDIDTNTGLAAILDVLDVVRPAGPLVRSGHGWHLWYAASGLPSRVGVLPDVDWRGTGGLIVAPPSLHSTGLRYTFQQPWTPGEALPACPPSLRRLVLPAAPADAGDGTTTIKHLGRYAEAALNGEIERILQAPRPHLRDGHRLASGGRNTALNLAAFNLGRLAATNCGLDQTTVWQRLTEAALQAGLGRTETHRTIRSGWNAGLLRPRR
ncbi:bifunctional DNA primase/polymerase [Actinoplanes sp. NPDC051859]|uniref:bifunctional DNA primase/polymerase n=1 Tax=Actinoplanes sp. NPDC051859 TaxID=3363909 RepID=UPI0037AF8D30